MRPKEYAADLKDPCQGRHADIQVTDDPALVDQDAALLAHKLSTMNRAQRRKLIKMATRKPKPKRKRKPRR